MIKLLRQLICEKPNCEECPKVKTLEKSVEYWKAQRELSYKSSKDKETTITQLQNVIQEGNKHISELIDYNVGLIDEIAVMEERIEALKKSKGLFYKDIPASLRIAKVENHGDYVYWGQTFWKLFSGFDVNFKPYKQHRNFYTGLTSASILILMKAGLVDNNTGEIKKGLTAVEVFDKIVRAVQYHISYVKDQDLFFFSDWQAGSTVSIALQKADCECSAQVVVDAFNVYEYLTKPFENHSAFVGLGYFKYGGQNGGHGYAMLIAHDITEENVLDKIQIGEATAKVGPPRTLKELKENNIYYGTEWGHWGTMNEQNLFGGYVTKEEYRWYDENNNYKV